MRGWFLQVLIDDTVLVVQLFKLFKISIGYRSYDYGSALCLTLGIWKFDLGITLGNRKKSEFVQFGEA